MSAYLGLPAALAARGLTVETVPGWQTRGVSDLHARGAVSHWTAGPRGATGRPSLRVVVDGRPDLAGPLCNVYGARDGTAVVVAARTAQHAGAGGWRGLSGNSSVFGTEMEGADCADFTVAQRWAYPRINAAYCDLAGFGPDMCCGHHEWAPTRKIDIEGYTMADMRRQIAALLAGEDDDMTPDQWAYIQSMNSKLDRATMSTEATWKLLVGPHTDGTDRLTDLWNLGLSILAQTKAGATVDPKALAAALAAALPKGEAKQVADELAARLAS